MSKLIGILLVLILAVGLGVMYLSYENDNKSKQLQQLQRQIQLNDSKATRNAHIIQQNAQWAQEAKQGGWIGSKSTPLEK